MREWEAYFQYEPTLADRMELQMAMLMQMLSGTLHKEAGTIEDFMVCPKKRVKKKSSNNAKVKAYWARLKAAFGGDDE